MEGANVITVVESLIQYAQRDYETKRIGWQSYAAHIERLYATLCEHVANTDAARAATTTEGEQ